MQIFKLGLNHAKGVFQTLKLRRYDKIRQQKNVDEFTRFIKTEFPQEETAISRNWEKPFFMMNFSDIINLINPAAFNKLP